MNYENWISFRYLISSKGRFLSFLNFVSICGVAIGVTALIVVTGVMTGFGNNLRDKIIGTTPHILIERETGIKDYSTMVEEVKTVEGIEGASPYIQGNVFLEHSSQALGLVIRGIDPVKETSVTKVNQFLTEGTLSDLKNDGVIIGKELARYFGYSVGDKVVLISPGSGISGESWRYHLNIVGIFNTGMADYDMNLILVSLDKAQEIFSLPGNLVSGIGVKIDDPYKAEEVKERLYKRFDYSYMIKSWIDINRNLFEALFLEKWGLFIILTLMVMVASFNIVSTLIVTVTSKTHDIGILKSIGAKKSSIRKIFTQQGIFIGFLGTLLGLIGGVGLSFILKTYVKVPEQIYSIDHVPVELQTFDLSVIVAAAMIISYLASIYPAIRAANLQPVEALRYE